MIVPRRDHRVHPVDAAHRGAAHPHRLTHVDLAEVPGYRDEFVGACFLPHTTPEVLRL